MNSPQSNPSTLNSRTIKWIHYRPPTARFRLDIEAQHESGIVQYCHNREEVELWIKENHCEDYRYFVTDNLVQENWELYYEE